MKTNLNHLSYLLMFSFFFLGCKKELGELQVSSSVESTSSILPYNFDWEGIDYMPAPFGINIPVPWANGFNQSFPSIYATDIRKEDGWELVYNTFSPVEVAQPAYFILYNRYRGLFRGYFYLTAITPIPSSNISHSLIQNVTSNPAALLSYSATEISNLFERAPITTTVQQYKTSATGTWYAAEFEMAYDPNIVNQNAENTKMIWEVNSVNTSNIIVNGVSKGEIKGTLGSTSTAPSTIGRNLPGVLTFPLEGLVDHWELPTAITTALKGAITNGIGGLATGILNGIFGGTSQQTQYANLVSSVEYNLSGTSTDVYPIQNPTLIIPGTLNQDNLAGYIPLYNKPLGVFRLTGAPMTYITVPSFYASGDANDTQYWDQAYATLVPSSYNIEFNPSIINTTTTGASIQNLKQEIISFKNYYSQEARRITDPIPVTPFPPSAKTEQIGAKTVIVDDIPADYRISIKTYRILFGNGMVTPVTPDDDFRFNQPMPSTVLRISFDVVPNNGRPRIKIVKTFNLILQGINYPSIF